MFAARFHARTRSSLLSLIPLVLSSLALGACCVQPTPVRDVGPVDAGEPDTGPTPDVGVDAGPPDTGPLARIQTNGAAIAVTRDDEVALVVNKNTGRPGGATVEKYALDREASPPTMRSAGSILLPDATQVIIGGDDNTAYAVGNGQAIKMLMIKSSMQIVTAPPATIGSEPRGMALSPSGALLYVANWSDGTVSVIVTSDMSTQNTIDLNGPLASSGVLGEAATSLQRPGLAHPYAIAVTDDGDEDDDDETVYVTEFFSQARVSGIPNDDSAFDLGRQGVVYRFNVRDEIVAPLITVAPRAVADAMLVDSNNVTTGCFPNQLSSATIHNSRLYLTGTCTSPRGPIGPINDPVSGLPTNVQNFKTLVHDAIYVINTETNLEEPAAGALLTRALVNLYNTRGTPDDESRRMALGAHSLAFVPESNTAYLTARGADALFRLEFDGNGGFMSIGSSAKAFVDLGSTALAADAGNLPHGVVISTKGDLAYVVNENSRNVSFVSLPDDEVIGSGRLQNFNPMGTESNVNEGRRYFATGLDRWSHNGQAWSSCESCHPGGLSDGVTWFTRQGPRQTISLEASFNSGGLTQRLLGWTANFDEIHDFEIFTRDISGGVGAIVSRVSTTEPPVIGDRIHFTGVPPTPAGQQATPTPQDGLNGTTSGMMPNGTVSPRSMLDDWNKIEDYVQTIRSPRAPSNVNMADAMAGEMLFVDHNCHVCHGGEQWTISRRFYTPQEAINNPTTGRLITDRTPYSPRFPSSLNPALDDMTRTLPMRLDDPANDSIICALRTIGTFPDTIDPLRTGVAPDGVRVREVRSDMNTVAQGAAGYNVPSLLGLAASAPYYHAGNARTLEEVFAAEFATHTATTSPNFPGNGDRPTLIQQLTAYLLTLDDSTRPVPFANQMDLGYNPSLCPTTLAP